MSRNHERAWRLLAERVRLAAPARCALYAILAALTASGLWWVAAHFGQGSVGGDSDELHRLAQEALALKVHGASAFATLLAIGAMGARHVPRGWALGRNRVSGSMVVAGFVLLIATGYALYYLVGETTHMPVSLLHWIAGFVLVPLLIGHVIVGRRSRRANERRSAGG